MTGSVSGGSTVKERQHVVATLDFALRPSVAPWFCRPVLVVRLTVTANRAGAAFDG
jgi:hypothetical protein